jgi:hypothetical protein
MINSQRGKKIQKLNESKKKIIEARIEKQAQAEQ